MRSEDEIAADAQSVTPFSNMTSFEVWVAGNCSRSSGCVHDDAWGSAPEGTSCPLITVAVQGMWPKEWPRSALSYGVGDCTEFEEVVAHATDDEPADENPDEGYDAPGWRRVETIKGQEGLF